MFRHIYHMSPSITQPTTIPTALCKTPACLSTHLGTRCIGVQLVLIDHKLHHCSMACPSCTVQHCVTMDVSDVEQRLHLGSQGLKSADMATHCSQVESIPSILWK